jgi:hypothetical protein
MRRVLLLTALLAISIETWPCTVWWEASPPLKTAKLCGTVRDTPSGRLATNSKLWEQRDVSQQAWQYLGGIAEAEAVPGASYAIKKYDRGKVGKVVISGNADSSSWIDVDLPPGMYVLDIKSADSQRGSQFQLEIIPAKKATCERRTSLYVSLRSCSNYLEQRIEKLP